MKDYCDHSQTKECGENCYHGRGIVATEWKGWKAIQGRGVEGRRQKEMRDNRIHGRKCGFQTRQGFSWTLRSKT